MDLSLLANRTKCFDENDLAPNGFIGVAVCKAAVHLNVLQRVELEFSVVRDTK